MNMIMIACHLDNKKNVVAFRILNSDTGQVEDYDYKQVYDVLARGINIDGITIENGEIKGTNGVFTRYTNLIGGFTISSSPVVIVKQYPDNSYTVSDCNGNMTRMTAHDIIQYAATEGIANGKIVHGENGPYISPICGEYQKDVSYNTLKREQNISKVMKITGVKEYDLNDDTKEIYCTDKDIQVLKTPIGCKGIQNDGFVDCRGMTEIYICKTVKRLGMRCFKNCHNVEKIVFEEGLEEVCDEALYGLDKVTVIEFPKSLKKLGKRACYGCDKLKSVVLGPNRVQMDISSLPRRAKVSIRRV